jgi:hypothetical protein
MWLGFKDLILPLRSKFQVEWGISIWVHQIGRAPCIHEWKPGGILSPYI